MKFVIKFKSFVKRIDNSSFLSIKERNVYARSKYSCFKGAKIASTLRDQRDLWEIPTRECVK